MVWVFVNGVGAFVGLLLLHFLLWRALRVRREMPWLFGLFILIPLIATVAWPQQRLAAFLTLCLSAAYVQTYPAAQAQSPSLVLIRRVHARRQAGGMSREEVVRSMNSGQMLQDRLNDLEREGLLAGEAGSARLKPAGRAMAAFFHAFRAALNLKRGQG